MASYGARNTALGLVHSYLASSQHSQLRPESQLRWFKVVSGYLRLLPQAAAFPFHVSGGFQRTHEPRRKVRKNQPTQPTKNGRGRTCTLRRVRNKFVPFNWVQYATRPCSPSLLVCHSPPGPRPRTSPRLILPPRPPSRADSPPSNLETCSLAS